MKSRNDWSSLLTLAVTAILLVGFQNCAPTNEDYSLESKQKKKTPPIIPPVEPVVEPVVTPVALKNASFPKGVGIYTAQSGWFTTPDMKQICDFDGDGIQDLAYFSYAGEVTLYYGAKDSGGALTFGSGVVDSLAVLDPTMGYTLSTGWFSTNDYDHRLVGEFTGDGRCDILMHANDGSFHILKSTGVRTAGKQFLIGGVSTPVDSAGKAIFTQSSGWFKYPNMKLVGRNGTKTVLRLLAANGDLMEYSVNNLEMKLLATTAFPALGWNQGWNTTTDMKFMCDVDGDGLEDLVVFPFDGSVGVAYGQNVAGKNYSDFVMDQLGAKDASGPAFTSAQGWFMGHGHRLVADFDGDGKCDVIMASNDGRFRLYKSVGGKKSQTQFNSPMGDNILVSGKVEYTFSLGWFGLSGMKRTASLDGAKANQMIFFPADGSVKFYDWISEGGIARIRGL